MINAKVSELSNSLRDLTKKITPVLEWPQLKDESARFYLLDTGFAVLKGENYRSFERIADDFCSFFKMPTFYKRIETEMSDLFYKALKEEPLEEEIRKIVTYYANEELKMRRKKQTISIFSLKASASSGLDIIISPNDPFFLELLSIFFKIDYRNGIPPIQTCIQYSKEMQQKIDNCINKYKDKNPSLNGFRQLFTKLAKKEYFFVLININLSKEEIVKYRMLLESINTDQSLSNDEIKKLLNEKIQQYDSLFENITVNYDSLPSQSWIRRDAVKKNHDKKICRFCGKRTIDGVTFKKKAHAIPEALGNKFVLLYDECDKCNGKFGGTIEQDLSNYLSPFLYPSRVKGKNGVRKFKGQNNLYMKSEGNNLVFNVTDEIAKQIKINRTKAIPTKIPINSHQKYKNVNVYKALCKIALSVMGSNLLGYFSGTIDWINNEVNDENLLLPKFASSFNPEFDYMYPELILYVRKNKDYRLPFLVADLRLLIHRLAYIIPFSTEDKLNFIKEEEYKEFWNTFMKEDAFHNYHNYLITSNETVWTFVDFSDTAERYVSSSTTLKYL